MHWKWLAPLLCVLATDARPLVKPPTRNTTHANSLMPCSLNQTELFSLLSARNACLLEHEFDIEATDDLLPAQSHNVQPRASNAISRSATSFRFEMMGDVLLSVPIVDQVAMPAMSVAAATPTPIVAAYYPDWGASVLPPENVDFDRFDWIDFAFAIPNEQFGIDFSSEWSKQLLKRLVSAAHAKNKFVKLSVGGWDGSVHFSRAVASEESRKIFVTSIVDVVTEFGLDGIDLDWEYPGIMGHPSNIVSPQDADNFLMFLQNLRAKLPSTARITAATQVWPFADNKGVPMVDVAPFAQVLDWILLMVYDTWGSSSTPGPNAPLEDACHNSSQPFANARAAVKSWTSAGFPASQLTLGVPAYGYISRSSATQLRNRRQLEDLDATAGQGVFSPDSGTFELNAAPVRHVMNAQETPGPVTVENEEGGSEGGQVQFRDLYDQGALKLDADGQFVGANGFKRRWDDCSRTPFLTSEFSNQLITYDDPESMRLKGAFALEAGLKGVNMFDAHGDTSNWDLIDAARKGLGTVV